MKIAEKRSPSAEGREERKEIISVVRDEALYRRLVAENPMLVGCKKHMLDNREENLGIPTRYNQFLEAYDYERGMVDFLPRGFRVPAGFIVFGRPAA